MKISKFSSDEERTILAALIVQDEVLGRVYQRFGTSRDLFKSRWANLLASWCLQFFSRYQRAPRQAIRGAVRRYAETSRDPETLDLLETFLAQLGPDLRQVARKMNVDYLVDLTASHLDRVRLSRLTEDIQAALERGDVDEARKVYAAYERIDLATCDWMTFDADRVREALRRREEEERLVSFPGDMDRFLSPHFKRGGFLAFAGPDKRGKSYWLQEVVWQALKQRRRVLYYVLGDMSWEEVFQRLSVRMTRKPLETCEVRIPQEIIPRGQEDEPEVRYRCTEERAGLTLSDVEKARQRLLSTTAQDEIHLRIKCEGGYVVSAGDIEQDVMRVTRQGWPPDLVVVDYLDLLAPEPHTRQQELRHQTNTSWIIMRRIALKNHCLVVGATQTAATAYSAWVIRKGDFSEDKRKNAHVTGMIGINQTDSEKEKGIYRLNWVVLRGGRWSESHVLWTAGELAIACPCIVSSL